MTGETNSELAVTARDLKQILGSLIFGANRPIGIREIKNCIEAVAKEKGGETAIFAEASESDIRGALKELGEDIEKLHCGFHLAEVAGGFRFQSDPACGPWLKQLLNIGKPQRLSRPALETLAIIAYRQPVTKAEIEGIRGVNVDYVIKLLMEMQFVRITGRSDLPGRPFMYGTTQNFLEHFGLKSLKDLAEMEPMLASGPRFQKRASKQAELDLKPENQPENASAKQANGENDEKSE